MLLGKRILAVIPARGGSKGIKLKNLIKLGNRTLIEWLAECVAGCEFLDHTVVSTDHLEIKTHAEQNGLRVPFLRPVELSGDRVGDVPVLVHALYEVESRLDSRFDIIVMLQPTSPFRKPEHIISVCTKLIEDGLDSVLTVSRSDPKTHPMKQLCFDGDKLTYFDDRGKNVIARQQLTQLYYRNGIAYAMTRECLIDQNSVIGMRSSAVLVDGLVPNIDTNDDIEWAEYLLRRKS